MIVVKGRQYLFHYGLTEKDGLRRDAEFVAILPYRSHFTVIKIYDLPVAADKSLLLSLKVFRVDARSRIFFLFCHC